MTFKNSEFKNKQTKGRKSRIMSRRVLFWSVMWRNAVDIPYCDGTETGQTHSRAKLSLWWLFSKREMKGLIFSF